MYDLFISLECVVVVVVVVVVHAAAAVVVVVCVFVFQIISSTLIKQAIL